MKSCVKTILTVSAFALMAGCSSTAQKIGELRADLYAPIYEAELSRYSESAKNDAVEYCIEKFKDSPLADEEYKEQIKPCLETEYNKRMDFYIAQGNNSKSASAPVTSYQDGTTGSKVYSSEECIGAVVNGVCHGSILPKPGYRKTCHGTMINGQCTGPMF